MKRRDEVLEKCLSHMLESGVSNLSLRPLAAAAGTSARLLIYHFGSREELIAAAVGLARDRYQQSFMQSLSSGPTTGVAFLRHYWNWATRPANEAFNRLFLEVGVLALQNPESWQRYQEEAAKSWTEFVLSALPSGKRNRAHATLCTAVVDGLMIEFLTTRQRRRTTEALELFIEMLIERQKSGVKGKS